MRNSFCKCRKVLQKFSQIVFGAPLARGVRTSYVKFHERLSVVDEVSRILSRLEEGDAVAASELLPIVYQELKALAAVKLSCESNQQTLQATALVHEAYLRLVEPDPDCKWNGKRHFFGAAAEAMRRILIERARQKRSLKGGGQFLRLSLEELQLSIDEDPEQILAFEEVLQRLAVTDPVCGELVKLRFFFAGLSQKEVAETMGLSRSTADRCWAFARAWLFRELSP